MAALDPVVETLLGSVISPRCLADNRFDAAAQFVGDADPWRVELSNQPFRKALCGFRVVACLNQNVERVPIGVHRAPQPMFHTIDRDHSLLHVPFVVRTRPATADTSCKIYAKPVDPKADGFTTNDHAALHQQILHIGCAQGKAVVGPNSLRNNLTRITKAFQASQINWNIHGADVPLSNPVNNLAIPRKMVAIFFED